MKHFIETTDWSGNEIHETLELAKHFKRGETSQALLHQSMVLLFLNPSLRTRISMIRAVEQLGGNAIALDSGKDSWKMVMEEGAIMDGDGVEHIKEAIPVLGRYCNFLGVRAFGEMKDFEVDRKDETIRNVSKYSTIPFVNLESAMAHPCQALADLLTIQESERKNPKVVLTWAPHPKALPMAVPNSFLLATVRMGWDVTIARPDTFDLPPEVLTQASEFSKDCNGKLTITNDRTKAFEGADVIYAKSWGSMEGYGNPDKEKKKKEKLKNWILTQNDFHKSNDAIFMHCLPVRRNVEVSDDVLDSQVSKVIDQAENRMHVQKAILSQLAKWNSVRKEP